MTTGTSCVAVAVCTALAAASLSFVLSGFDPTDTVGVVPVRVAALVMPIGFAVIAIRFILTPARGKGRRWIAAAGVLAGLAVGWAPLLGALAGAPASGLPRGRVAGHGRARRLPGRWPPCCPLSTCPLVLLLVVSVFLGGPIFVLVGGLALLFFLHSGGALESAANQAYTMLTGDVIPSIPLFTLAGTSSRRASPASGWCACSARSSAGSPGGLAFMSILICAFLTTFTGASGVTIIAVGGAAAVHPQGQRVRRALRTGACSPPRGASGFSSRRACR